MAVSFNEIVALAKDRTASGRRRMAGQFSNAFLSSADYFTENERAIALDIMAALLRDAALEVRQELAQRLAIEPNVPNKLLDALANDVIEVAQPILQLSQAVDEGTLLKVVSTQSLSHRLAIAQRNHLSDGVTAALVANRETPVALALLKNNTIHIPSSALQLLAVHAYERTELADLLVQRRELTPDLAQKLYWLVADHIQEQISEKYNIGHDVLKTALQETVLNLALRQNDPARRRGVAERLVATGGVNATLLVELLKNRGVDLFRDLFGVMSKFKPSILDILFSKQGSEALSVVCRAFGFSKTETASLLMLVHDRVAGEAQFNPAGLAEALRVFTSLTEGDAKTVLWQWQSDPGYLFSLVSRRPS